MKIVHPTDFSVEAEAAEQEAVRLARRLNGELVLVHVATETPLYGEQMFAMPDVKRIYEAQARWAEERLAERAAALTREGVPTRWRRRVGVVHAEIGTVAREEAADYIVIGTHGRGGLDRVMLGSVAERVVRTAPCPVITVRQR
ncbi:MAG TPA: universal stress protein [Methylomirabilota bacterium]|nr:universal stress protein [Methylomirabilota bacterium]